MIGKVELPLEQYHKLHDQAKFVEQGREQCLNALEVGLREVFVSIVKLLRSNGYTKQVTVSEFDSNQIIEDIVLNDKVLHLHLVDDDTSINMIKFIVKTGPKDKS